MVHILIVKYWMVIKLLVCVIQDILLIHQMSLLVVLKSMNVTEVSVLLDFAVKMLFVPMLMDPIIATVHLDTQVILFDIVKTLMNVLGFMVSMVSVDMAPSVKILLVVMLVPVDLDSPEIRENLVLTLMNVPNLLVLMESVDSLLCVPILLVVLFVDVHLEALVIHSFNVSLKIIAPMMTLVLVMLSVLATSVTVPLLTLAMIANVSH